MYTFYIKFSTYAKAEIPHIQSKNLKQKYSYPHVVDKVVNKLIETLYIVDKWFFVSIVLN